MRYLYAATVVWASIASAYAGTTPKDNDNSLVCPGKTITELHQAMKALVNVNPKNQVGFDAAVNKRFGCQFVVVNGIVADGEASVPPVGHGRPVQHHEVEKL